MSVQVTYQLSYYWLPTWLLESAGRQPPLLRFRFLIETAFSNKSFFKRRRYQAGRNLRLDNLLKDNLFHAKWTVPLYYVRLVLGVCSQSFACLHDFVYCHILRSVCQVPSIIIALSTLLSILLTEEKTA